MRRITVQKIISLRLVIFLTVLNLSLWSFTGNALAYGTLQGFVRNEFGFAISGGIVSSSEGSTDVTESNGAYKMAHTAGSPYTITASAIGYTTQKIYNVSVSEGETTLLDFALPGSPIQIDSVYPSLVKIGQTLNNVKVTGEGFDADTRMSTYIDSGDKHNITGSVDLTDWTNSIKVRGNIAYVANGNNGLIVVDVSNPTVPLIIGTEDTPGYAEEIEIVGQAAFVADSHGYLQVIDISDPTNPVSVGSVNTPGNAHAVAAMNNNLYVVSDNIETNTCTLQVFSLGNSSIPSFAGALSYAGEARDIMVVGTTAYVTGNYSYGLKIIDVSDPTGPGIIGTADWDYTSANKLTIQDDMAFVADASGGLKIVDISDPVSPKLKNTVDIGNAVDVVLEGNIAYIADGNGSLQIIKIQFPLNPKLIGSVATSGIPRGVTLLNDIIYLSDGNSGLLLIDVNFTPSDPVLIGSFDTPGKANGVTIANSIVYVADDLSGLQVIDVSDPHNPSIIGSLDTSGFAKDLKIVGDKIYLAAGYSGGLQIIDVSDPTKPNLSGTAEVAGFYANGIDVVGDKAYLAAYAGNDLSGVLKIININNPQHPFIIGSIDIGSAKEVSVIGGTAYVASRWGGLQIVDVSNPGDLNLIKSVGGGGQAVSVVGSIAYMVNNTGLQVIDISDPENAFIKSSVDTPGWAQDIFIINQTAFVADFRNGIHAIDISDPENPIFIGSVDTPGFANDVRVIGNIAYVADDSAGLTIVPIPVELTSFTVNTPTEITATLPNPPIEGNYIFRVFNSEQHDELLGAVTFTNEINLFTSKAIIVAGGGPDASGDIWEETKAYAGYAYESLIYQGYLDKDIYYLTDELSVHGRDGSATKDNLKYAITQWAKGDLETSGLLLYLVDHGAREEFQIRGGEDMQNVSASELDTWLDTLQETMHGKVVFIYDACKSGSFISSSSSVSSAKSSLLSSLKNQEVSFHEASSSQVSNPEFTVPETQAPQGTIAQGNGSGKAFLPAILFLLQSSRGAQDRIIITSSSANQVSYFLEPKHSFSYHFWSTLAGKTGNKANLSEAFTEASSIMAFYQTPQLDANGNGTANEDNDLVALQDIEGTIYALRRQYSSDLTKPVVGIVSVNPTLGGSTSATLMARSVYDLDGDAVVRVWAEIVRPDFNPHQGDLTVTDIPTVELTDPYDNGVYEGEYDNFDIAGAYIVNFYAEDAHGIYSQPKTSLVVK